MRYILYCRKSTDTEDKQVMSLDSQEKEMRAFAEQQGLEIIKVFTESKSAKAVGRPVFDLLLAELNKGKAEGILCWKLDRLARNMTDAGRVMDMLQRGVIHQIRTHDAIHLPTDNVLMLAVQLGMANQYIRDLSENVKRGNRTKLEQGGWPNRAPFGYKNDKATKELVVHPKESKLVRRAFDLYATGQYLVNEVRKVLNKEGFRTSSGTPVNKSLVERILRNPFYSGVMFSHGKYYEGKHEPIVGRELYEQAQNVLSSLTRPKVQKHFFPLRGILRCAGCTCAYTANIKKGHTYYYCTNGKGGCDAHSRYLQSKLATELVSASLYCIQTSPELIDIMAEAKRELYADQYSYTEAIQKRLKSQLEALERQELKAYDDSFTGILRKELYERKMRELGKSRIAVEKDLNELVLQDGLSTLEPVKNAYIQANTMQSRFEIADPIEQQRIANEVLWNLFIKDGQTEEVKYKSYFEVLANRPIKADLEIMLGEWG